MLQQPNRQSFGIRCKHVTEQSTLLNSIINCKMRVGQLIKPFFRHVAFYRMRIIARQHPHCIGSYVNPRMGKWTLPCKLNQIPIDPHEIKGQWVGCKNRFSRQVFNHCKYFSKLDFGSWIFC